MVIHGFGDESDARHVAEGRDEVLTLKRAMELAVFKSPAFVLDKPLLKFRVREFVRGHDSNLLEGDFLSRSGRPATLSRQQQRAARPQRFAGRRVLRCPARGFPLSYKTFFQQTAAASVRTAECARSKT